MIPFRDGYYWACYNATGDNPEVVYVARDIDTVFRFGTPTRYRLADFTFVEGPLYQVKTPNISMVISRAKHIREDSP